jgi:WD40 repeat protein
MVKLMVLGTATATALGLCVLATAALQPGGRAQIVPAQGQAAVKDDPERVLKEAFPFFNDKDRLKDALYVEIGNMRPLIKDKLGIRFQSREAVLSKDGTAVLWSPEKKDPIARPLRHKGPIRELTFFDESNLLITTSDESVKVWDALTGEPRKELDGQGIWPMWLAFAPGAQRFVTISTANKTITVWDAAQLTAVATLHPPGPDAPARVGLSGDGKTVVQFRVGPDPSVVLWDVASGRTFATLRPPSPAIVDVFTNAGAGLNKSSVQRGAPFWDVVQSLAPKLSK